MRYATLPPAHGDHWIRGSADLSDPPRVPAAARV